MSKLSGFLGEFSEELDRTAVISKEFKDRLLALALKINEEAFNKGRENTDIFAKSATHYLMALELMAKDHVDKKFNTCKNPNSCIEFYLLTAEDRLAAGDGIEYPCIGEAVDDE